MKRMYTYKVVDDKVPIGKLGFFDMLRAIFLKMNESDAHTLLADSLSQKKKNRLKANLVKFIKLATEPIRKGTSKDVILKIPSSFKPVLREVLEDPLFLNYYSLKLARPDKTFYGVRFNYKLYIKIRGLGENIEMLQEEDWQKLLA